MNIKFKKGLLGLESYKNYVLEDIEGNDEFKLLKSLDDSNISIVLISPFYLIKNYEVELNEKIVRELCINNENDVLLFSTVTLNSDMKKTTVNLRAPLVINVRNCIGEQIILNKECYNIKHPLIEE